MEYNLLLKGFVGSWDFDADYTRYVLDRLKDQPVTVCIDSLGGRLNTALSISAAFKDHGDVHVHYVGMNASAATIASLGAKHVSIDQDAFFLVHNASYGISVWQDMNADQIEEFIAQLEKSKQELAKFDAVIAKAYARRCKKSPEELAELMKKDTFITAAEALEWGFVDEVTDLAEDPEPYIDPVTAEFCAKAGIMLPDCVRRASRTRDDDSFLSRIVASVKSAFSPNHDKKMNKDSEHVDVVEQPQNNAADPEDKDAVIASLRAELAEMKAGKSEEKPEEIPGEKPDHKHVIDDGAQGARKSRVPFPKSARDLFDSLP
ncbi:MAG: Clp protease ClpP [Muribaculaceae bacterium]|nr:Clp protease ClpP [Muribaculaceae bacterium]